MPNYDFVFTYKVHIEDVDNEDEARMLAEDEILEDAVEPDVVVMTNA